MSSSATFRERDDSDLGLRLRRLQWWCPAVAVSAWFVSGLIFGIPHRPFEFEQSARHLTLWVWLFVLIIGAVASLGSLYLSYRRWRRFGAAIVALSVNLLLIPVAFVAVAFSY
jgi:hypothetical protein